MAELGSSGKTGVVLVLFFIFFSLIIQVESSSVVFFEPSSPYFLNTILIGATLLFIAVACGLFYQAFCYKQLCEETGDEGVLNIYRPYMLTKPFKLKLLIFTILSGWLAGWLASLSGWLAGLVFGCLPACLPAWLTDCLTDELTDGRTDGRTDMQTDNRTERRSDRLIDRMTGWHNTTLLNKYNFFIGPCTCGIVKKEITKSVETFYYNFSKTYHRIREKHIAELAKHPPTYTGETVKKSFTYKP